MIYSEEALAAKKLKSRGVVFPIVRMRHLRQVALFVGPIAVILLILILTNQLPKVTLVQGLVESNSYNYLAEEEGYVERVFVKQGQAVVAGDDLLLLRKRSLDQKEQGLEALQKPFQIRKQKAEANYQQLIETEGRQAQIAREQIDTKKNILSLNKKLIRDLKQSAEAKQILVEKVRKLDLISTLDILTMQESVTATHLQIRNIEKESIDLTTEIANSQIVVDTWQRRSEYLRLAYNSEMASIHEEEMEALRKSFILVKSSIDGTLQYAPFRLNEHVPKGHPLIQVEAQAKESFVIFRPQLDVTLDELAQASFEMMFTSERGQSGWIKVTPLEIHSMSGLEGEHGHQNLNLKFALPTRPVLVDGRALPLTTGTRSRLAIKIQKSQLLRRMMNSIHGQLQGVLTSVSP